MIKYSKILVAITLLFVMLLGYFHPINAFTQDLGRHILTGKIILHTMSVPKTNLFSYTYADFPVINTHWLSEVVFALIDNTFSAPGLFVMMLLLITFAGLAQMLLVSKKTSLLALGVAGLLYIRILFERTDLRPELFSFLFLSLFVSLLYRYRTKPTKLILLLIPLQFLWVNMHIYFAIGLVVQALFLIDFLYYKRHELNSYSVKVLVGTFLGSILVACINPYGIQGMLYPLHVFNNYGYTIEENQTVFLLDSLGFQKPSIPYLKFTVLLLFVSLGVSWRKTRPIDWMLSIVFTVLAFSAVRNMPLFVFATFIPFTLYFTDLLQKMSQFYKPNNNLQRISQPLILGFLVLLVIWQVMTIISWKPIGYGVTPGASRAVTFLKEEHIAGPMFNNFDIGGYLISELYPSQRVFVDGRPEAYPAAFFREIYMPMQENQAVFDQVVAAQKITTIFFPHTDQTPWGNSFMQFILKHPDWSIIYVDDFAIILVKRVPQNERLITKYGMSPEKLKISKSANSFDANLRIVAFLLKVNLTDQSIPYLVELVRQNPKYCPGLGTLAQLQQQKQDPSAFIYAQKYNQTCM